MLSKVNILRGYFIQNIDDETIGRVKDIYFDDRYWTVRYLVANTGSWLTGRKVLISPCALVAVNADRSNVVANLTKKQIEQSNPEGEAWDYDLRSCHEVTGYGLQTEDGEIGHVKDFVIDDETWEIRYLVVSPGNSWAGKKVLISPLWIERVNWGERKVFVNVDHESIKQSPEYTEVSLITRDYEAGLYDHYHRKGYWADELVNNRP